MPPHRRQVPVEEGGGPHEGARDRRERPAPQVAREVEHPEPARDEEDRRFRHYLEAARASPSGHGRPDEGERPDRPLRRQRARELSHRDDDEDRNARERRGSPIADQPPKDGDEHERDDSPADAHLLFEHPLADAGGSPDATRDFAEERVLDGRNEVAPPFRAVSEQVGGRQREGGAVDDDGVSHRPPVRDAVGHGRWKHRHMKTQRKRPWIVPPTRSTGLIVFRFRDPERVTTIGGGHRRARQGRPTDVASLRGVISLTGIGDHDQPESAITLTGVRKDPENCLDNGVHLTSPSPSPVSRCVGFHTCHLSRNQASRSSCKSRLNR